MYFLKANLFFGFHRILVDDACVAAVSKVWMQQRGQKHSSGITREDY